MATLTSDLGFRNIDRHIGVPQSTLSKRVMQIEGEKYLELLPSNRFRVMQILADDGNEYLLLEVSDWVILLTRERYFPAIIVDM